MPIKKPIRLNSKLGTIALALGLATTSCATLEANRLHNIQINQKEARIAEVMRTNHARLEDIAFYLPEGYVAHRNNEQRLKVLVGLRAGTIKAKKTDTGYALEGYVSTFFQKKKLIEVLKEADTNGDKIITSEEVFALQQKILRELKIIP